MITPILYLVRDKFITESRLGRIEAFLNPFEYEQGFGYQVVNGYFAIGAGGLEGLRFRTIRSKTRLFTRTTNRFYHGDYCRRTRNY